MYKRQIIKQLRAWREREGRKPLVLRGARQVGKTTLVNVPFYYVGILDELVSRLPWQKMAYLQRLWTKTYIDDNGITYISLFHFLQSDRVL